MIAWVVTLRSLGFGAALGAGVGLAIAIQVSPRYLNDQRISPELFATAGALVGAGAHELFNRLVVDSIARPLSLFMCYYFRLYQLRSLIRHRRRTGRVTRPTITQLESIIEKITIDYFQNGKCP